MSQANQVDDDVNFIKKDDSPDKIKSLSPTDRDVYLSKLIQQLTNAYDDLEERVKDLETSVWELQHKK